ncbi:hypothetical protein EBS02_08780 [bacterium]|nr:hypothetical protein [bacterium]
MGAKSSRNTTQNNRSDGHLLEYFRNTFVRGGGGTNPPNIVSGLTATGGVISDYNTPPGAVYRAHIFTSSGTFSVSALGTFGDTVEYLVVGGGGGGGLGGDNVTYQAGGGGGGAGGLLSTHPDVPAPLRQTAVPISGPFPAPFTITIGAGGAGGVQGAKGGQQGTASSIAFPSPVSTTGGGGGSGNPSPAPQRNGGSGGGGEGAYSPAPQNSAGTATSGQGNAGGAGSTGPESPNPDARYGGGGGGAGGVGTPGVQPNPTRGVGGVGLNISITGTSTGYAGGGSAGAYNVAVSGSNPAPPIGGGGTGGLLNTPGGNATYSTGGGGGSANSVSNSTSYYAGNGGSGIVVVRYQIAQLTAQQKATGGAISYYGGKTIHTFTSTGSFVAPGAFSETVEIFAVGGGAGGSNTRNIYYYCWFGRCRWCARRSIRKLSWCRWSKYDDYKILIHNYHCKRWWYIKCK